MRLRTGGSPGGRRVLTRKWLAIAIAIVCCLFGATTAWAYNYYKTSFDWYGSGESDTYSIRTAGELEALSAIVNGEADVDQDGTVDIAQDDFSGKTVVLTGNINLLGSVQGKVFTPIGSDEDHAFQGTFDGSGFSISGILLDVASDSSSHSYIGLFGVVGENGSLSNVKIANTMSGKSTVVVTSDSETISYVGSLVGWCKGSVYDSSSAASVTTVWDDGDSGDSRTNPITTEYVGGLTGSVEGALSGSSFSGALSVRSVANAVYDESLLDMNAYSVRDVGGVVGRSGCADYAVTGLEEVPERTGSVSGCTNTGPVYVFTVGDGGLDRFGEVVEAKSMYIGGIAGYAAGSFSSCTNSGNILATGYYPEDGDVSAAFTCYESGSTNEFEATSGGGAMVGGIVGGYRAGLNISAGTASDDAGVVAAKTGVDPSITLTDCTNTGYVTGLVGVGGIVGRTGTYTTITRCVNGDATKDAASANGTGYVRTTRWNKPNGGGIAGQSLGVISWSRNYGAVVNTKIGHYSGGIAGGIFTYTENGIQYGDMPEIYSCYSTGQITCSWSGGILGENNGYVHDCVVLKDTVYEDCIVNATSWAIVENCIVACPDQATADKLTAAEVEAYGGRYVIGQSSTLSILNTNSALEDYANYYFAATDAPKGYPVLNGENYTANTVDLSKLSYEVEKTSDATYSLSSTPTPHANLSVIIDGQSVTLYEGVDFRVVADPASEGQGVGDTVYKASITGIGNYTGTIADVFDYTIVKGDLSATALVVSSNSYNCHAQNNVTYVVRDGNVTVPAEELGEVIVNNGEDCVDPTSYTVVVKAAEDGNYTGEVTGDYAITKPDLYKNMDFIGIYLDDYDNDIHRVWYYDETESACYEVVPVLNDQGGLTFDEDGMPVVVDQQILFDEDAYRTSYTAKAANVDENGNTVYGISVPYTGSSIEPELIGMSWTYDYVDEETGQDMTNTVILQGDKVIYGRANTNSQINLIYGAASTSSAATASVNLEGTGGMTVAANTYTIDGIFTTYFHNYLTVRFEIVKDTSVPFETATITPYGERVIWKSDSAEPYEPALDVVVGGITLTQDSEYTVEVARVTDANGTEIAADVATRFAVGNLVYYNVVSADGEVVAIETPWTIYKIESVKKVTAFARAKNLLEFKWAGSSKVSYSIGADNLWETVTSCLEVYDKNSGNRLKPGYDFDFGRIYVDVLEDGSELALVPTISNLGYKSSRGYWNSINSAGTMAYSFIETNYPDALVPLEKITIDQYAEENFLDGQFVSLAIGSGDFPWCQNGYSKELLENELYLNAYIYRSEQTGKINDEQGFIKGLTVEKMVDDQGVEVEKLQNPGTYYITVSTNDGSVYKENPTDNRNTPLSNFEVQSITLPVTVKRADATNVNVSFIQTDYEYTGEVVYPEVTYYIRSGSYLDLGVLSSDYYQVVSSAINVSNALDGEKAKYTVDLIVADEYLDRATSITGVGYFYIEPADIESDTIEVRVADAYYTGEELEPEVTFWNVSDPENPVQLHYKEGQDYTLAYSSNVNVAAADSDLAPTVTITTQGSNMVAETVTAHFNIVTASDDVTDYTFSAPANIIEGEEPHVVGKLISANIGNEITLSEDAYQLTYVADKSGTELESEPKAGDTVYLKIEGVESAGFRGTKIVGPVAIVFSGDANDLSKANADDSNATITLSSLTYNGKAQSPVATVVVDGKTLVEGVDYTCETVSAVNAGEAAAITVSGINGYHGSWIGSTEIAPKSIDGASVTIASQPYTGQQIEPAKSDVTVTVEGVELSSDDWTYIEGGLGSNVEVEDGGSVKIQGTGNYTGEVSGTFEIIAMPFTSKNIQITVDSLEGSDAAATYTGAAVELGPSQIHVINKLTGNELSSDEYEVAGYANNVLAGTAEAYVSGIGNYNGTTTAEFTIAKADIASCNIEGVDNAYYTLTDGGATPVPVVKLGDTVLPESDYVVSYKGNDEANEAALVIVTAAEDGNLAGDGYVYKTFRTTLDISRADVTMSDTDGVYGAADYDETGCIVGDTTLQMPEFSVSNDGEELVEGVDYVVAFTYEPSAGDVTAVLVGQGDYEGSSKEISFKLTAAALDLSAISLSNVTSVEDNGLDYPSVVFDGVNEPDVVITDGTHTLEEGKDKDYWVEYLYNDEVSQMTPSKARSASACAYVAIHPGVSGNYVVPEDVMVSINGLDSLLVPYYVLPADLTGDSVNLAIGSENATTLPYEPALTATFTDVNGEALELVEGIDYEIEGYENSETPGVAYALVKGIGNFSGETKIEYPVVVDLGSCDITAPEKSIDLSGGYDLEPTVKLGDVELANGSDYSVSYKTVDGKLDENGEPASVGTYARVVSGNGNYVTGTRLDMFTLTVKSSSDVVPSDKVGADNKIEIVENTGKDKDDETTSSNGSTGSDAAEEPSAPKGDQTAQSAQTSVSGSNSDKTSGVQSVVNNYYTTSGSASGSSNSTGTSLSSGKTGSSTTGAVASSTGIVASSTTAAADTEDETAEAAADTGETATSANSGGVETATGSDASDVSETSVSSGDSLDWVPIAIAVVAAGAVVAVPLGYSMLKKRDTKI